MAKVSRNNGVTSVILRVKLLDSASTTGAGKTGLTSASGGLVISTISDVEAAATAYSGSNIEGIATLGTFAAPTSGKVRFKEVDATNHPGVYEIQIADARYAVSNATSIIVTVQATGVVAVDAEIDLKAAVDTTTNLTNAPTAGDLTATMKTSVTTAATAATPTVTAGTVSDKTGYALTSGERTSIAAAVWNALTSGFTVIGSIGESLVTVASNVSTLISRIVGTLATGTHNPQSGDAYARLGSPAGASIAADIADLPTNSEFTSALGSLETHGDSTWATAVGFSTHSAGDVWTVATRVLTANTNLSIPTAGDIRAAVGLAAANLDTQLGTKATQTSVDDLPTNAELATALSGVATAAAQTTAQNDLDILTGADGANLKTGAIAAATFAADTNVYQARIAYTRDDASAVDEWTVRWFKNGAPVTSGITSPTLTVMNRAGSAIISAQAMTEISGGVLKYDASGGARVPAGDQGIATVSATIDGSVRTGAEVVSRDTTA